MNIRLMQRLKGINDRTGKRSGTNIGRMAANKMIVTYVTVVQ